MRVLYITPVMTPEITHPHTKLVTEIRILSLDILNMRLNLSIQ